MTRTTLFTSANKLYEMFVLPYVLSSLIHNSDARVEVCLENAGDFTSCNAHAIDILLRNFGSDRCLFRDIVASNGVAPNSTRFLETPESITEFTYIGDIDILILEEIAPRHLERMKELRLPYSNVLREGREALSGLHFTRSESYYPISMPPNVDLNRDEELLYQLVTARGLPLPPSGLSRPVHGYHLSPNRSPLPRTVDGRRTVHWGLDKSKTHLKSYQALQRHPAWMEMYGYFDRRYRLMLGLLDLALASTHRRFRTNLTGEVASLLHDLPLIRAILASE